MVGFWIWMVWGSHISKAQWAWILPPTDGQPKWLGHSAFSPPFGTHDGLEIHPISKRVTFQLEKQANNRDLKKKNGHKCLLRKFSPFFRINKNWATPQPKSSAEAL